MHLSRPAQQLARESLRLSVLRLAGRLYNLPTRVQRIGCCPFIFNKKAVSQPRQALPTQTKGAQASRFGLLHRHTIAQTQWTKTCVYPQQEGRCRHSTRQPYPPIPSIEFQHAKATPHVCRYDSTHERADDALAHNLRFLLLKPCAIIFLGAPSRKPRPKKTFARLREVLPRSGTQNPEENRNKPRQARYGGSVSVRGGDDDSIPTLAKHRSPEALHTWCGQFSFSVARTYTETRGKYRYSPYTREQTRLSLAHSESNVTE